MRVFISADLEGISGVVDWKDEEQSRAGAWMTADANAAVEGAFDGGAGMVRVRDAHGSARNIQPDSLDPRAELCRGWGADGTMVEGVEDRFDALFLVGYHARYGTEAGVLSHTWCGFVRGIRLGDMEVGEIGLAAITAGAAGVPLVLVTGDAEAAREAEAVVPGVRTAVVKVGATRTGGCVLPFREAHRRIREAACLALESALPKPFVLPFPLRAELSFRDLAMAATASRTPLVERSGDYSVAMECPDVRSLLDFFFCAVRLASTA